MFQFGYILPTIMKQAGVLMVWEDLKHSAIEPSIREGINQLAGISEDVKKVLIFGIKSCVVVFQLSPCYFQYVELYYERFQSERDWLCKR